jgi:hypothetical protein
VETILSWIFGLILAVWGMAIATRPSRVKPGSISHLVITRVHFGWINPQRKGMKKQLTRQQIRLHGVLAFTVGLILSLAALAYTL